MAVLSGFQAYADRRIRRNLESSLYERLPLLSVIGALAGTDGKLGRPGTSALIGGMPSEAKRKSTDGSDEIHIRYQRAEVAGGKNMPERGTSASTGDDSQDQQVRSALFKWTRSQQPIKVWNNTLLLAGSNVYKIRDAIEEATQMAMETLLKRLNLNIWTASPSDTSLSIWDNQDGLTTLAHPTNTYGTVDRNTANGTAWAGKRSTTAASVTLKLIDDANLIQGIANTSNGVDLALTTNLLYSKLKAEALAKGATIVIPKMGDRAQVGFMREAINYNGVIITFDPDCPTSHMFCTTTRNLTFEVHPAANFKIDKFVDQGQIPGGDDARTSKIEVMYRFWTPQPWNHTMFTNLS